MRSTVVGGRWVVIGAGERHIRVHRWNRGGHSDAEHRGESDRTHSIVFLEVGLLRSLLTFGKQAS